MQDITLRQTYCICYSSEGASLSGNDVDCYVIGKLTHPRGSYGDGTFRHTPVTLPIQGTHNDIITSDIVRHLGQDLERSGLSIDRNTTLILGARSSVVV
jgi:hypothetical protein